MVSLRHGFGAWWASLGAPGEPGYTCAMDNTARLAIGHLRRKVTRGLRRGRTLAGAIEAIESLTAALDAAAEVGQERCVVAQLAEEVKLCA